MVDMAMRQPDLLDRDIGLLDGRLNFRKVPAGIDDDGLLGRRAPKQCAVLFERRYRDDHRTGFRLILGWLIHKPHNADFLYSAKENFGEFRAFVIGTGPPSKSGPAFRKQIPAQSPYQIHCLLFEPRSMLR